MQFNKKINLINKMLKKKKETPIVELKITNYNNSNFYLALVYTNVIDKFKVLYIPLDVVDNNKIEEYSCYQFIEVKSVIYIIDQIKKGILKYKDKSARDKRNKNITSYDIEIDTYINNEVVDFHMTRYLPKEWKFFFETIVMLFEHAPNIMSELATELLSVVMNTNEVIDYQASLNCDLNKSDLTRYFPSLRNEKERKTGKITYLEQVNGKYYGIMEGHLYVIEYSKNQRLINIFCDKKDMVFSNYTYQLLMAIKNEEEEKFYKIKIKDNKNTYYYLCLGLEKSKLKIIRHNKLATLSIDKIPKDDITILEDKNNKLKEKLEES